MSTLQITLRSVEQMIEQLYFIAGQWLDVDASKVSVSIGDDLSVANEPNPTSALIALVDSGLVTDEQAVQEAKRQGILSSYFELSKNRPKAEENFGMEPNNGNNMNDVVSISQESEDLDGQKAPKPEQGDE